MDRQVETDVTTVIGCRRKQSKRFNYVQAVPDRVRAAHHHATITAAGHSLGGALALDTIGTHKPITFNKVTSLHDGLSKRKRPSQTDNNKT
jgi:hypothetical protein